MICRTLDEGEQFHCAGNLYTMLIPRDDTCCFEAALESVAPGGATPPNAHATFVQMYFFSCRPWPRSYRWRIPRNCCAGRGFCPAEHSTPC